MHSPAPSALPDRRDLWIAVAAALGATLFHLLYFDHGVRNWIDLGVAATDAARILDGEVFGREFIAPYGPGRYYLTALWFRFFGESLYSMSLLYVCLMAVVPFFVYLTARRFAPRFPALAAALLAAVVHGPMHKVYIGFFSVLFVWAACRAWERRTFAAGFVMGFTGAVAGIFRYDLGALAMVCGILVLASIVFVRREEDSGMRKIDFASVPGFIAGGLIVVLPAAVALAAWGDLEWVVGHILHRAGSLDLISVEEPDALQRLAAGEGEALLEGLVSLLYLATPPLVVLAGLGALFVRGRRASAVPVLLLGLCGLFLLNQWRLIPRFSRLSQVGPLIYVGMVFLFQWLAVRTACIPRAAWTVRAVAALVLCALLIFVWTSTGDRSQDSVAVLRFDERYLELDRAKVWVKRQRCEDTEKLVAVVQRYTVEGEAIFAGPGCPIVYFLAERPNPTPYTDPFLYFYNADAEGLVIGSLEKNGVRLFVDQPKTFGGPSLPVAAPRLWEYLDRNFPRTDQVGKFVVRRR